MDILTTLPAGFQIRSLADDDLDALVALLAACGRADYGGPEYTREDLLAEWPGHDPAKDVWVVTASDGPVIAYAALKLRRPGRFHSDLYVDPAAADQGLAPALLSWLEARVRERAATRPDEAPPADQPLVLVQYVAAVNTSRHQDLAERGYVPKRRSLTMQIMLDSPPPAPVWPDGITVRGFVPDQDVHAVFTALDQAFRDHWGNVPWVFEEWRQHHLGRPDFDPALWFLAMDGEEIAGAVTGLVYQEAGCVDLLGVGRRWRRRGLGTALLHQAFGAFYARGWRQVDLGVDADSGTGGLQLYEAVGMHVAQQYDGYEKEVRPS